MYHFHVTLHAQPPGTLPTTAAAVAGQPARALSVTPDALANTTFACSFEEAAARLGQLGRMYCEPDGSFVWASPQSGPAWQVDGNLYDRHGRLLFVDLKGTCPADQFDRLLTACGWPQTKVMFQWTQAALFLDEAEFRRLASVGSGPV